MQTSLRFKTDPAHTTSQFLAFTANQYSQPAGAERRPMRDVERRFALPGLYSLIVRRQAAIKSARSSASSTAEFGEALADPREMPEAHEAASATGS